MNPASQTMIARIGGYERERRGLAVMVVGALVLVLSMAAQQWPPRALADTNEAQ